jgi:hypothetical protein
MQFNRYVGCLTEAIIESDHLTAICADNVDELNHWKRVLDLHTSSYDILEPFTIPSLQCTSSNSEHPDNLTSLRNLHTSHAAQSVEDLQKSVSFQAFRDIPSPAKSTVSTVKSLTSSPTKSTFEDNLVGCF